MNLWAVDNGSLKEINTSRIDLENQLEEWIYNDPSILNLDILIIGRQVHTQFGGYIDLLGINRDGDLVVIELKRDKTPRDIVAQCLDYASWVCDLGFEEITALYHEKTRKDLSESFSQFFDDPLPETLNNHHQMVIVASSLDDSTERIIQYLTDKHSVNINAVFFNVFELSGQKILGRSFFNDPEVIEEKSTQGKRAAWSGTFFVNTGINGDNPPRDWNLNMKHGFISAGGGPRWITAIKKLKAGDKIFAYIKGCGYVGYGVVEEEAVAVTEFKAEDRLLLDELPDGHEWKQHIDPNSCEWLARVRWLKTCTQEKAKWLSNGFANQNVVCKLRDARTFEFLKTEFGVEGLG